MDSVKYLFVGGWGGCVDNHNDNGTGYQAVTISGRLRVSGNTFTTSNAAGLIYIGDGIIDIEGGTTTVCQMWNVGAGRTTYRQSGGTCILNNIGETNNSNPVFKLESVDASFQMTGEFDHLKSNYIYLWRFRH